MTKVSTYSAPKEIQREALKWLAQYNGPAHSSTISAGITQPNVPLWNIGQNLSVLKKNKMVTRNPHTAAWSITTAGASQAHAWMIADGDIVVAESAQPEYVWQIAVVVLTGRNTKTEMDSDWEAFAADYVGSKDVIYFRKLVEK